MWIIGRFDDVMSAGPMERELEILLTWRDQLATFLLSRTYQAARCYLQHIATYPET